MAEETKETPAPEEPVEDKEEEVEAPPIDDLEDDQPPPEEESAEEEPVAEEEKEDDATPYDEEEAPEEEVLESTKPEGPPDFSIYVTNVAERLWRAREAAKDTDCGACGDLIKRSAEYQDWRKKVDKLNGLVADYAAAMKDLSDKRTKVRKIRRNWFRIISITLSALTALIYCSLESIHSSSNNLLS